MGKVSLARERGRRFGKRKQKQLGRTTTRGVTNGEKKVEILQTSRVEQTLLIES